jgi:hypothetical protein
LARAAVLVLLAPLSVACASQAGFGRATTLAPGTNQASIAVEASLLAPKLTPESAVPLPWLQVGLGYKRGITERVEIGGRVYGSYFRNVLATFGLAVDTKVQIYRHEPDKGRLSVAAAGSFGYHQTWFGGSPWHAFGGTLPVLFGIDAGKHQFVLGPRFADYVFTAYGQNAVNTFWLGASAGFAGRIRERGEIFPELVLMWSPVSFNGETDNESRVGVTFIELAVSGSLDF